MLSYQHIYHAGCRADVHKHQHLAKILSGLGGQVTYFETHAGRGLYDLNAPEALKTGEAEQGIAALLREKAFDAEDPYYRALLGIRKKYGRNAYPGSPLIARKILGNDTQMYLFELHPQEYACLADVTAEFKSTHIYRQDGYEGVLNRIDAEKPIVLIDPSFEVKSEYLQAAQFIEEINKASPKAVIILWYPILRANNHLAMINYLDRLKLSDVLKKEAFFPPAEKGMLGSGLYLVNAAEAFN